MGGGATSTHVGLPAVVDAICGRATAHRFTAHVRITGTRGVRPAHTFVRVRTVHAAIQAIDTVYRLFCCGRLSGGGGLNGLGGCAGQ